MIISTRDLEDGAKSLSQSVILTSTSTRRYVNDLEPPAFALEPALAAIKAKLLAAFPAAMMSGSGTSLFAVADDAAALDAFDDAAFKDDVKRDLGLDVGVWRTTFVARAPGTWYAPP